MLYRTFSRHSFSFILLMTVCFIQIASSALAQSAEAAHKVDPTLPINVTTRVFQLSAARGKYSEINDQVFSVTTAKYLEEEKWLSSLKKLYPEFTPALLRTSYNRAYRVSKPTAVKIGKVGTNNLEVWLSGAQSPGDGVTPGTSMVIDVNINQGLTNLTKPVTYALQPLEVESGKTYFFASRGLKFSGSDYVNYLRPGSSAAAFANEDVFFVFAFSIELAASEATTRLLGERDSLTLQEAAVKKVPLTLPDALAKSGFTGKVQVRVEIAPDGKVTKAMTYNSYIPELNELAIKTARQWEFGTAPFAEDKRPVTAFITFDFPTAAPAEKQPASK